MINHLYILIIVNCEWNHWINGECSETCGGGTRTRFRTKKLEEKFGGICLENATHIEECNTQSCSSMKHCHTSKNV